MPRESILKYIRSVRRPVFTTYELSALSGKSPSTTTQALNHLAKEGLLIKIYRGIWAESGPEHLSAFTIIPFLFPKQRVYVSFLSALHLHGIIEQIPQIMTLATTSHTRMIKTRLGTFSAHQIAPAFFAGFHWYGKEGRFLIAEPEKALVDALYISTRKKRQFAHFPELHFPKSFSWKKAKAWTARIPDVMIKKNVRKKLSAIIEMSQP